MKELGDFLGVLTVFFYILALFSFVVKWKYKHFKEQINEITWLKSYFPKIMKFFVKNHRIFGSATILLILMHFGIQFSLYGVNLTGALAASLMFLQVLVGVYGVKRAKPSKNWLWIHRILAVTIGIAIIIHVN